MFIYPICLIVLRAAIALIIAILSIRPKASQFFLWLFILGFSSDFFDGVLARNYHSNALAINVLDGVADFCLYAATFLYFKKFYMDTIRPYYSKLKLLVVFQIVAWVVCLIKFGHISSWHTYMAKIFGLTIIASVLIVATFRRNFILPVLLIIGALYLADDIAITLIMPYWKVNVMSAFDALGYRK
jgi:CDP-diacylglycerol--glycerol-3-phosphate 3-phosphatidyltransferase